MTRKFGLLGKTLAHSFSQKFFTEYFAEHQIDAQFVNLELPEIAAVQDILNQEFHGLTVTIPYKEAIIPYLDRLTPEAQEIGAVNAIQFSNGETIGHNSDAYGFRQSIKPFLTNNHERALILGTGGAAKAVAYVFKTLGIDVIYCSRNPTTENQYTYDEINNHMINACKVIVNCTPVGTFPEINQCLPFPFEHITQQHLIIDLIYNPTKTTFLQQAENHGATILNGESMLKEQALKAWQIWTQE